MPEIIACPECRRRLQLPTDSPVDLVRCPSCKAEFPADSVPRLLPAGIGLSPSTGSNRPPPPARRERDSERPVSRRPVKSSSWSPAVIVLSVLGVVILVAAVGGFGIAFLVWQARPKPPAYTSYPKPMPPPDFGEMQPVELPQALDQQPVAANDLAPELKPLFADLGAAFRASDVNRVLRDFDTPRMADEFTALAAAPLRNAQDKRAFERGVSQALRDLLVLTTARVQWKTFEIRDVKKLNDNDVVAVVRHVNTSGTITARRWWLTRRTGNWKVYDMENLAVGMRYSILVAANTDEHPNNFAALWLAVQTLRDVLAAIADNGNMDDAQRKLQQIEHVALSRPLEAVRHLVTAKVAMHRDDCRKAVVDLDKAAAFHLDMPTLDLHQGYALNGVSQWDEARKHLEAYHKLIGDEATLCAQVGLARRGGRHFAEAAVFYRKSLDLDPKNADTFQGLWKSIGAEDPKDDLGPRFAKLDDNANARRAHFDQFAADCVQRELPQLLEPLLLSMTGSDPEYVSVFYYTALFKAHLGHADLAVVLFKAAMRRQTAADKREQYVTGFLKVMGSSGKCVEAYAAVPNAREAFRVLAAEALRQYRREDLRQLVAAHAKTNAADPLLPWYQAEVYAWDSRYALADKTFAAALAHPPDDDTLELFRSSRVIARYYTGHALDAYREIAPRDETFQQLANLAFYDHKDEQLQALLDAHAKNEPDSFDLLRFRIRLKIHQNKVDEALAWFKTALAKRPPDDKRAALVSTFLTDMATAGKPLEAYRAAPDAIAAFKTLAGSLRGDARYDDLQRLLDTHRAGHADDPWLAYYQGEIHVQNKAWDKAAQVLADGRKKAPEALHYMFQQPLVYAQYKAGHGLQAYAEVEPHNRTFTLLADMLLADKDTAGLEKLLAAHRRRAADDPELFYYEARVKVLLKQPAESAALLQKACQKQTIDYRRQAYVTQWAYDMDAMGQGMEGYRLASDKSVVFETLAYRMVGQKKDKELAALLEEYGKEHAEDTDYRYFRGQLHLLRGEADEAADDFAACLAASSPTYQWRNRNGLLRARVKAGKTVAAYREAEAGMNVFENLARVCVEEKDAKQLQALLDAHRQASPDDPAIPTWEVEIKWLNEDYEGVLKLLDEHNGDVFVLPRNQWRADDRRVRSLIKLKRTADAIRAADAVVKEPNGSRVLLVLAHAATGNVKDTIAVVEKLRLVPYQLTSCYQDTDLGSILKSEAFREFREKFPEPKDELGAVFDDDD